MDSLDKVYPNNKKFAEDLKEANLPFDLVDALTGVVTEIVAKKFKYKKLSMSDSALLIFERPKERIIISVTLESLLIRHFDTEKDTRKLRVLYIAKPAQRKFKLL